MTSIAWDKVFPTELLKLWNEVKSHLEVSWEQSKEQQSIFSSKDFTDAEIQVFWEASGIMIEKASYMVSTEANPTHL
jgi:hypothetical protein